jgi:hypothetical protein
VTEGPRDSGALKMVAALGGVIAGLGLTLGLIILGSSIPALNNYFPTHQEFGLSRGEAIFYVITSIGVLLGLIGVLRARLAPPLRIFLVVTSVILLGFFVVCDLFALPQV